MGRVSVAPGYSRLCPESLATLDVKYKEDIDRLLITGPHKKSFELLKRWSIQ
jgi:hypothetical protein